MNIPSTRESANYFSDESGEAEFHSAFVELFAKVRERTISKYLRPENTHQFNHGNEWAHPAAPGALDGEMKKHSSEVAIPLDKFISHDLTLIDDVVSKFATDMERQFAQMMYATVSVAAEKIGNTVSLQSAGSPREVFAQMLEKVQFSADKSGNVTLPEIHLSPETAEQLKKSIAEAPPEFNQRIEEIKARKFAEAVEREVQRKLRFVRYGCNE